MAQLLIQPVTALQKVREAPTFMNAFDVRKVSPFKFLTRGYIFATSVWNGF